MGSDAGLSPLRQQLNIRSGRCFAVSLKLTFSPRYGHGSCPNSWINGWGLAVGAPLLAGDWGVFSIRIRTIYSKSTCDSGWRFIMRRSHYSRLPRSASRN